MGEWETAMTKTIDAVYEGGVLRPLKPLKGLPEHAKVKVMVSLRRKKKGHPLDSYFGVISNKDAKLMRDAIEEEFEKVDPDEWQ